MRLWYRYIFSSQGNDEKGSPFLLSTHNTEALQEVSCGQVQPSSEQPVTVGRMGYVTLYSLMRALRAGCPKDGKNNVWLPRGGSSDHTQPRALYSLFEHEQPGLREGGGVSASSYKVWLHQDKEGGRSHFLDTFCHWYLSLCCQRCWQQNVSQHSFWFYFPRPPPPGQEE